MHRYKGPGNCKTKKVELLEMATQERYIITGISVQFTVLQEKKGNSYSPSFPS